MQQVNSVEDHVLQVIWKVIKEIIDFQPWINKEVRPLELLEIWCYQVESITPEELEHPIYKVLISLNYMGRIDPLRTFEMCRFWWVS